MDALFNHTQKQAQVYIIPFTTKAINEKGQAGHNFLSKVFTHARCIYKETPNQERYTSTTDHPSIKEAIYREWGTRLKRADFLYESLSALQEETEPAACFEILHNMLTQVALGLIYIFLEYKPSYTSLPYLLHLCTLFTDLPNKVFPKNNYRNHHIYHHLCNARTMMIHKTKHSLTLKDADRAWKKCGVFMYEAESLVEIHFVK